jgi:putative sugar O-methyltransferase
MKNISSLVSEFIKHADEFYTDLELGNIDAKHVAIVQNAYKQFNKSITSKNFRNWGDQSDLHAPAQITFDMLRIHGYYYVIVRYFYRKLFQPRGERISLSSVMDDIDIIKNSGGGGVLKDNPIHKTPGVGNFYQFNGYSVNARWLRYIYLLSVIRKQNLLSDGEVWVDIGSYYGGLQGMIKKYYPNSRIVLVDFHHQLCRSFVYLKSLYPDAIHIFPNQLKEYKDLNSLPEGSISYIPANKFSVIANNKVHLATNFFSFGEMKREVFSDYINSNIFSKSKTSYIVNRFVSSPYFDRVYDTDLNVLDYQNKKRRLLKFDVFPIHHYMLTYSEIFYRKSYRNSSSSYFEMITLNDNE